MKNKDIKIRSFYRNLDYFIFVLFPYIYLFLSMLFGRFRNVIFSLIYLILTLTLFKKYRKYRFCYIIFKDDELFISYIKEKSRVVPLIRSLKLGWSLSEDSIINVSIKYFDIKIYGLKRNLDEYKSKVNDIGIITKTNKRYVIKEKDYTKRQLSRIINILDKKISKERITINKST